MSDTPEDPKPPKTLDRIAALKRAKPLPILTDDQKAYIDAHWQMDVREIARGAFNNQTLDGRSIECKAVKVYLASMGKAVTEVRSPYAVALDDEQKAYIAQYYEGSSPLEMARILFKNPDLTTASGEYSAVVSYCRMVNPLFHKSDEMVDELYDPPSTMDDLLRVVNKYAINDRPDGKAIYVPSNLSNQDRKQLTRLMSYMGIMLFSVEANKYRRKMDRELFISTFVLNTWDKPDLLAGEVQQYISYSAETVRRVGIERQIQQLDERHSAILDDPNAKPNMTEIEWINAMRQKLNESLKQSAALLKALEGDRAKRLGDKVQSNASMHNLVETWKREEDRRKIIQMAERKQKAALKAEVVRLSDLDSLTAEIFGLSEEDILN